MLYKFLLDGLKSSHGNTKWEVGKWERVNGEVRLCDKGFHASEKPLDALSYISGAIIVKVDVRGKSDIGSDKQCWSQMRIIDARKWTKLDSVSLAIFAAELVIDIWELTFPTDARPRKAIETAKAYLDNPDAANATNAANAAANADAATCAARATANAANADAAAYAANAAANAANAAANAARAAANAARATTYAAANAANAANADAALLDKINNWIVTRFETLERISK